MLRFNGSTGALIDTFAMVPSVRGITFGNDGKFYATSGFFSASVRRHDGVTGAFLDTFLPRAWITPRPRIC